MVKKRVLGLTVAFMLTATSGVYGASFSDVKDSSWAAASINKMSEKNYVGGFPDGTFKPQANISRAEFIAIINKINGFTDQMDSGFKDLSKNHWAYAEIKAAIKAGYVGGFPDGTFRPNLPVTREESAVILNNIYKFEKNAQGATIKDLSKVSPWAAESVINVVSNGIMSGYKDASFAPKQPVTRAECIVVLDRIVEKNLKNAVKPPEKSEEKPVVTPQPIITPLPEKSGSGSGGSVSGGGSSSGNINKPTDSQVNDSLRLVSERLNGSVKKELKTDLHKETANIISSSLSKYTADKNYSIDSDVETAKSKISQMSKTEYNDFKNAITGNIPAKDLDNLNKYFDLKK